MNPTNCTVRAMTPTEAVPLCGIDPADFAEGALVFLCDWTRPNVSGYYEVSEKDEITCTVGRESREFTAHHEARDWLYYEIFGDQVTEAEHLAWKFDNCLRCDLSAEDYARAILRNRAEKHPDICHTHDFCDANVTMARAFEIVKEREINLQSDEDGSLWGRAWKLWRKETNAQPINLYLP